MADILSALMGKPNEQAGIAEKILSERLRPTFEDASRSSLQNAQALFMPEAYKPIQANDFAMQRMNTELAIGDLVSKQAQAGNQNAKMMAEMVNQAVGEDPALANQVWQGLHELPYEVSPQNAMQAITSVIQQKSLSLPKKANAGGSTGELIQRYMDATGVDFPTALYAVQTGFRQGTMLQDGTIMPLPGVGESKSNIKYGEESGKQKAVLDYASGIAAGKELGQVMGEKQALLNSNLAKLPQLMSTVDRLGELGKTATYTFFGRGIDVARREAGMQPREGAVARAEYISLVDNQILPLLRDTFGAQFTQKEGESLKVTLGDPNKSPAEKDAVLRSFISQKISNIQSLQRETGMPISRDDQLTEGIKLDDAVPEGVSQEDWQFLTPEERALWR